MLAITVLELARNDLESLDRQLAAKVAQAPNFFSNAPLVLALDKLPANEGAVDLPGLMRVCRQHGLRTLAIRASRIEDIAAAIAVDLPVLPPSGARERPLDLTEGEPKKNGFRDSRLTRNHDLGNPSGRIRGRIAANANLVRNACCPALRPCRTGAEM